MGLSKHALQIAQCRDVVQRPAQAGDHLDLQLRLERAHVRTYKIDVQPYRLGVVCPEAQHRRRIVHTDGAESVLGKPAGGIACAAAQVEQAATTPVQVKSQLQQMGRDCQAVV